MADKKTRNIKVCRQPGYDRNGGTPKFSVSLIIPKSDKKTIAKIEAAIEAAYREGEAKLKGNGRSVPALSVLKTPLRDGDTERPDGSPGSGGG